MVERRISLGEVFRGAIGVINQRVGVYIGATLLMVGSTYLFVKLGEAIGKESTIALGLLGFVVQLFLFAAILVCLHHSSIMTLRGDHVPLIPSGVVRRIGMFLWKFFLLTLVAMFVGMVAYAPVVLPLSMFVHFETEMTKTVVITAIKSVVMFYFLLRFGFVLPAIACGDESSFKKSWNLTKQHSFRLYFSIILVLLVSVGFPVIIASSFAGSMDLGSRIARIILAAMMFFAFLSTFAVLSVWYEKFRLRYEAQQAAIATEADYGQCQD